MINSISPEKKLLTPVTDSDSGKLLGWRIGLIDQFLPVGVKDDETCLWHLHHEQESDVTEM